MNHSVGCSKIQSSPPSFEADEKNRHFAVLKMLYWSGSISGVTAQLDVFDAALIKPVGDQVEHAGKLGEYKDSAPFGNKFFQHLHQGLSFALSPTLEAAVSLTKRGSQQV